MRRTSLIPAALLVVLVLGGCGADSGETGRGSDDPSPAATSTSSAPADGSGPDSVTALTVPDGGTTGRCAVPTPEVVAGNDLAFDGVVESMDGGVATLRPTEFYAGEPTDTVTVQAPGEDLQALLAAVSFEQGGRYLVAADDGRVAVCTVSAPWSAELAATYEQAFGAP